MIYLEPHLHQVSKPRSFASTHSKNMLNITIVMLSFLLFTQADVFDSERSPPDFDGFYTFNVRTDQPEPPSNNRLVKQHGALEWPFLGRDTSSAPEPLQQHSTFITRTYSPSTGPSSAAFSPPTASYSSEPSASTSPSTTVHAPVSPSLPITLLLPDAASSSTATTATTASSTPTPSSAPKPKPPPLPPPPAPIAPTSPPPPSPPHCLAASAHDVFFAHADIPTILFNIHTPWTVRYPSQLSSALRGLNYTIVARAEVDEDDEMRCGWRVVEEVEAGAVERGLVRKRRGKRPTRRRRRDGDGAEGEERQRQQRIDGVGGLAATEAEIRRVLEETYPWVEIVLILAFTLWPVYAVGAMVVVACVSACFCGRKI
ncbi:hypothetical protein B0J12DRAFT_758094 [Macrophomina phaseolina]|uniref:Uncharacterized protein n=1 Tax=Macrophomina phaseolina TaxID=35725 RepID=A0ABQ8GUL1_9PEZI|nr:hypothetical protein B0J12DRAFT_758094 [Macrophomina phaseolina]